LRVTLENRIKAIDKRCMECWNQINDLMDEDGALRKERADVVAALNAVLGL